MGCCSGCKGWPLGSVRRRPEDPKPVGRTPPPSGYRGHPTRSYLSRVERDNPVGVRERQRARQADREEGLILQRAQDGPRSQGRRPKGSRKPKRDGWPLPLTVSDNWSDTGFVPGPERVLTWAR